jgi:hypothetical protein
MKYSERQAVMKALEESTALDKAIEESAAVLDDDDGSAAITVRTTRSVHYYIIITYCYSTFILLFDYMMHVQ